MKKQFYYLSVLPVIFTFVGCDESEDPVTEVAQAEAVEAPAPASEPDAAESSLMATADALKEVIPELQKEAEAVLEEEAVTETVEEAVATVETESIIETEAVVVEIEEPAVEIPEVAVMEVEEPAQEESLMSKTMAAAGGLASQLDLSDLSWDSVADIPYDNKAQLLLWATEQANSWKDKLSSAAMEKGTDMLGNLGDSGWQGALKTVMDAINGVRESSPETWELARGALVSAWGNFEDQANAFLNPGKK